MEYNDGDILIRPVLTEKTNNLMEKKHQYVFFVSVKANKCQIIFAIQRVFGVQVESCRIVNCKPKSKMVLTKKGQKKGIGFSKAYKKAYISVKDGANIDFSIKVD